MSPINTIQSDPKFDEFCKLACYFMREYGVKVWHTNIFSIPEGKQPEDCDILDDFYAPLAACGFNLENEVYCFGSSA